MSAELLPCPFCGERESLLVEHLEGTIIHPAYQVRCDNCGASSDYNDNDHVAAWNRRAQPINPPPAYSKAIDGEARPDGGEEAHWKVGEFRSSHSPRQIVLVLSVGAGIERDEQHRSFVRWVYTHPAPSPDAVSVDDAMVERFCSVYFAGQWPGRGDGVNCTDDTLRDSVRVALTAALSTHPANKGEDDEG